MKKTVLMAIAILPFFVKAQTVIFSDNFESYSPGDLVAASSDVWTTWSGGIDDEDATVSDAQSYSGSNSAYIVGNNGPTDLVLPFPSDYTSGVYELDMKMYIVEGGYFNLQQSSTPGINWMFEIYFDNTGSGYINAGGASSGTFSFTNNSWVDVKIHVDLTNDQAQVYINSLLLYTWQWSLGSLGTGAADMWGGVDIFATSSSSSGDAEFYVDDVTLTQITSTCPQVTNLFTSNITAEKAKLNWTAVDGSLYYLIRYREFGTTSWTVKKVPGTYSSKVISGLSPETKYMWEVKTFCSGGFSDWTLKQHFKTGSLKLSSTELLTQFNVYPNPSNGNFNISYSGDDQVSFGIYDLNGLLLKRIDYAGNTLKQIDLTDFSNGVYFIKSLGEKQTLIKKIEIIK